MLLDRKDLHRDRNKLEKKWGAVQRTNRNEISRNLDLLNYQYLLLNQILSGTISVAFSYISSIFLCKNNFKVSKRNRSK